MVLWNRVVTNLENARELIAKWLEILSERVRIEVSVAKILVEKGKIEHRLDIAYRKIGEKVFQAVETDGTVDLADPALAGAVEEARDIHREMIQLQTSADELTRVRIMDEGYLKESNP